MKYTGGMFDVELDTEEYHLADYVADVRMATPMILALDAGDDAEFIRLVIEEPEREAALGRATCYLEHNQGMDDLLTWLGKVWDGETKGTMR